MGIQCRLMVSLSCLPCQQSWFRQLRPRTTWSLHSELDAGCIRLFASNAVKTNFLFLRAALSLAFTAGSKTSGVPICGILTVVTAWIWRKEIRTLLTFAGFYLSGVVLFGSIETYVLSWHMYHRPLGPVDFVHDQRNRDGLRGLSANFIRYYLGNISFGVDGYANQSGLAKFFGKRMPKDS